MVRPVSILRMEGGEYGVARVWQTVAVKSLTPPYGPALVQRAHRTRLLRSPRGGHR
jgi:hypothetical protein